MTKDVFIRLYEDSSRPGQCSARSCGAGIDWFETLNGKQMPMNRGAVPVKSENEPATMRVVAFFSSADSHFSTCPAAGKFGRRA